MGPKLMTLKYRALAPEENFEIIYYTLLILQTRKVLKPGPGWHGVGEGRVVILRD